jgi:hypothetical protein
MGSISLQGRGEPIVKFYFGVGGALSWKGQIVQQVYFASKEKKNVEQCSNLLYISVFTTYSGTNYII